MARNKKTQQRQQPARWPEDEIYPEPSATFDEFAPPTGLPDPGPGYDIETPQLPTEGIESQHGFHHTDDGLPITTHGLPPAGYALPPQDAGAYPYGYQDQYDQPELPQAQEGFKQGYPIAPSGRLLPVGYGNLEHHGPSGDPYGNDQVEEAHPFLDDIMQVRRYGFPPVHPVQQIQPARGDDVIQVFGDEDGYLFQEGDDFNEDDDDIGYNSDATDYLPYGRVPKTTNGKIARALHQVAEKQSDDDQDYDEDDQSHTSADDDELSDEHEEDENDGPRRRRGGARGRGRGRGRTARGRGRGRRKVGDAVAAIDRGLGALPERGRKSRRGRVRGRGRGRARGGAVTQIGSLEDDEARHSTGAKPGVRVAIPPTAEFVRMQAEASSLFIEGQYKEAELILQKALAGNPEQYTAHSLLAEIYINTGEKEKAAMSFFLGAYSNHREQNVWKRTADLIVNRVGVDEPAAREFALHSYRQAVTLDRVDFELRRRRAWLLRESKYLRKAASDYKVILEKYPCDSYSLQALAEICVKRRWPDDALPYFKAALPDGHDTTDEHECEAFDWIHGNLLADLQLRAGATQQGLSEIKRFARFLLGRADDTLWDNAADDSEFDADHESRRAQIPGFDPAGYDLDQYGNGLPIDMRMKMGIMRLRMGPEHLDEAKHHFSWFPTDDVDDEYVLENTDVYLRIAGNFFATQHYEDALLYYEALRMAENDLTNLHLERLAICYEHCEMFDEAEELYLGLAEFMDDDLVVVEKLASLFERAGLEDRAEHYNQRMIEERRKKIRIDEETIGASTPRPDLELEFGQQEDPNQDPEEDVTEPVDEREDEEDDEEDEDAIPLPEGDIPEVFQMQLERMNFAEVEPAAKAGKSKRRRVRVARRPFTDFDESQIKDTFQELDALDERTDLDKQIRETRWLEIAGRLVSIFKKQKVFYPSNHHLRFWGYTKEAQQRSMLPLADQLSLFASNNRKIEDDAPDHEVWHIPTEFCEFHFDRWLELFLRSALILSSRQKSKDAYALCDSASAASPFAHEQSRVGAIRNIKLVCALNVQDDETVSYVAREFMKEDQFAGDAYRLFMTANLALPDPNLMWNSSINQKYILRQVKALDAALTTTNLNDDPADSTPIPTAANGTNDTRTSTTPHPPRPATTPNDPAPPTSLNPELLMLYAQMLYAGGSHTEALSYLHRVYALVPDDPLLCLLMALSYSGWAFKRMSGNRHYLVVQGLTMLEKYKEVRIAEDGDKKRRMVKRMEVEFNLGRFWQNLGLAHLSVPCYERCLEVAEEWEERREKGGDDDDNAGDVGFAREAALALRGIWAVNGQVEEAEKLTERWLVL